jgi:glycosyltransferase involved in cell wall biosynthesis
LQLSFWEVITMNDLVSILIPAFNAERWIGETLKSALGQTWPNCEIIVVDDGSCDNTFEVANRFQSRNLKVIRQENLGASAARNQALSHAQGDYIQWLDADDLLGPDKISRQLLDADAGKDSLRLLSSTFGYFYYRRHKAKFTPTRLWQDLTPLEWLVIRFTDRVWIQPAAWLVSRRLADQAGPWDERLSLNDDGEYFARLVATCEEIKFVPEAKSYYRQANVQSLGNTLTHKACESLFLSLELCYRYLLALENSERTRAVAARHLQASLIYFYPEEVELLGKIAKLSQDLGSSLAPPEQRYKFMLVRSLLGWEAAKKLVFTIPRLKRRICGSYDRLLEMVNCNAHAD